MRLTHRLVLLFSLVVACGASQQVRADSFDLASLVNCTPTSGACTTGATSVTSADGLLTMYGFGPGGITAPLSRTTDTIALDGPLDYVGIASGGGTQADEIDYLNAQEMLVVEFAIESTVYRIEINKLFPDGYAGDSPSEEGSVCAHSGSTSLGCSDFVAASTDGRLALTISYFAWGSTPVTRLEFTALDSGGIGAANSDYGISSITLSPVPEPGTMLLFGSGLAALALRRRLHRT